MFVDMKIYRRELTDVGQTTDWMRMIFELNEYHKLQLGRIRLAMITR